MAACIVIAHRGASAYAPENTLAAFDLAFQMGARHAELDVHSTRDGHVVVIHDAIVDRTTNGSGPVASRTLAFLRKLDAGSWFGDEFRGERIPTLDEVLERYKDRLHIHIEIKGRSKSISKRTADLVRKHGMIEQVTVISFQKKRLNEIRSCAPELSIGWLVEDLSDSVLSQAKEMSITLLCPRADALTCGLMKRLHAEGFVVQVWGLKDEDHMRRMLKSDVDRMTVDYPGKLIAYLETGKQSDPD